MASLIQMKGKLRDNVTFVRFERQSYKIEADRWLEIKCQMLRSLNSVNLMTALNSNLWKDYTSITQIILYITYYESLPLLSKTPLV